MYTREKLKRHAGLMDRMAEAQGLDLEEQMLRGRLDFGALEDAVLRCAGCENPDDCARKLDAGVSGGTPGYCRNTALFAELGKG